MSKVSAVARQRVIAGWRYTSMIAVLLVATAGLHLVSRQEAKLLARPLSTFPVVVDGLQGHDIALEKGQIQATNVDDYLLRAYREPGTTPPLFLYIGYYKSQRVLKNVHTPRNCLPGSGWEPVTATRLDLRLPDGRRASVNFYVIEKGPERQIVLYWYQAHGRVIASEYWGKFYTLVDAMRLNRTDATVVRISTPVLDGRDNALKRAGDFAQQTLIQLENLIPR